MTSKRRPGTASSRSPTMPSTRTPLSRAPRRALSTARRERSTAVTDLAPASAALIAMKPLPVHTSSAVPPRSCARRRMTAASRWVSERGRNTPGNLRIRTIAATDYPMTEPSMPTAAELRDAFDAPAPLTLGLEEELMLLDRGTFDLLPRAAEVVDAAGDD